jgi:arginine:ornithine antiporter/lysine permease
MVSNRGESYEIRPEERRRDLVIASVAVIYTVFMILAGGLKFILLSAILYAPGTVLYVIARRERKLKVFEGMSDWAIFIVAAVAAIVGVVSLATGVMAV